MWLATTHLTRQSFRTAHRILTDMRAGYDDVVTVEDIGVCCGRDKCNYL